MSGIDDGGKWRKSDGKNEETAKIRLAYAPWQFLHGRETVASCEGG